MLTPVNLNTIFITDKLMAMEKCHNNSMFKTLLVLCLSITLLLSQADRLHIHIEHNDHSMSSEHVAGVHPESTLHDVDMTHHHDNHQDEHSTVTVDVSADKIWKKANLLDSLLLIFLFIGVLLTIPRLTRVFRQTFYKIPITSCYYLLQPPLRAPPVK